MVAPIKKLAAVRGDDPRAHTLVAFGGAGGQHACAVARELGMTRVLCSPHAGVLSALGIGLAGITKFAERALASGEPTAPVFAELETSARARMSAEGVATSLPPRRMLEMRYQGQEARLTIPEPPDGDFEAAFIRQHQREFGFVFTGRPIENYAARVELSSEPEPMPEDTDNLPQSHYPAPAFHTETWDDTTAAMQPAAVYERAGLRPGAAFDGPAIVLDAVATVVVEAGWRAKLTPHGDLLLDCRAGAPPAALSGVEGTIRRVADSNPGPITRQAERPPYNPEADPVELELFHGRFTSVAEQMGVALRRTALSTNVKERLDFSCALFDADGRLVANAAHIPVHLGAMEECVRCLRADVPDLRPGEVYITNDPFRGGSHLPDVTVITPVFSGGDDARPAFFTASRAHHAEIGGIAPGSLPPDARTLSEEGVLIRAFRYRTDAPAAGDDALRGLLLDGPYPSRSPDENLADLHAQMAANATGAALLQELIARHGPATVAAYAAHLQRTAETKMRAALARFFSTSACSHGTPLPCGVALVPGRHGNGAPWPQPDITRRFEDAMDDGTPIVVAVTVRADGTATLDFTGSGPVHPRNLNANRAIVASAAIYCLRCLLDEPVPLNAGLLAPVTLLIPPGTLLDPPGDPDPARCPAVGGGNVETSQRLVDVILSAFGLAAQSQGTMNNLLFGRSRSSADGAAFGYYETMGGGAGAGPDWNGASAVHVHMTNTRLTDPEILETRYPVRLREWSVRRGSGGAGKQRGGEGMVRAFEFLAALDVSLLTSRRATVPHGTNGGQPGQPGRNRLQRAGEADFTDLPPAGQIRVGPGDVLGIETPGGGGLGEIYR